MFGRIWDALTVEVTEEVKTATPRSCGNCRWWVPPEALTLEVVPTRNAIQWAQDGGYGRCCVPKNIQRKDAKRFTQPSAFCEAWSDKSF
ncbi:MAG: hypothetical protein EAZ99_15270 [Alphaproteobacteria bacterium]|nr:MAG: hypothetical protein EAZ99_15270 [Alphaproteobacteria bacterium]